MWWSECFPGFGILLLLFLPCCCSQDLTQLVWWSDFFFFFLTLLLPRPSSNICGVNVLCSPNICDGVNVLLPFCCQDLHPKYVVEVMFFVHPTYMVDWVFHALCCCLLTLCCQFNAFFLHPTYIVELMFCVHPELMFCVHPVYIWWTDCFMLFAVVVVTRLLTVLCVFCYPSAAKTFTQHTWRSEASAETARS